MIISAIGAAAVGGFLTVGSSMAYKGDPSLKGPNYSPERHEEMQKIFENKDFEAWKSMMQGRRVLEKIDTQEKFNKFVEMRNLKLEGKIDEASKLGEELGIGFGEGKGTGGMGGGKHKGQSRGGHFVDDNKDGICDHMQ